MIKYHIMTSEENFYMILQMKFYIIPIRPPSLFSC